MNPLVFPCKSIPSLEMIKLSIDYPKQEVYIVLLPKDFVRHATNKIKKMYVLRGMGH